MFETNDDTNGSEYETVIQRLRVSLAWMMNPLSSERHSAGAVTAFDGQTDLILSRRNFFTALAQFAEFAVKA